MLSDYIEIATRLRDIIEVLNDIVDFDRHNACRCPRTSHMNYETHRQLQARSN